MEKFLEFWSHYNATIIEGLVALILISVIYLAYRTFFGARGPDAFDTGHGGAASVDTTHIEKTLQKILEQQSAARSSAPADSDAKGAKAPASAELIHEVSHLKKTVEDKDRQITTLKEKVEAATKAATQGGAPAPAPAAAAAAASGDAGLGEKERQDYVAKIKELEARLSEYEIISEDIADVSFFKEENARLNREVESLKAGGSTAPAATAPAATAPAVAAAPPIETAPAAASPAPAPAPTAPTVAEEVPPAAETVAAAAPPEASEEAMNAIDDSLMAEFAKAVEGQKEGTLEQPAKSDEDAKLLEEFENFSKKS